MKAKLSDMIAAGTAVLYKRLSLCEVRYGNAELIEEFTAVPALVISREENSPRYLIRLSDGTEKTAWGAELRRIDGKSW